MIKVNVNIVDRGYPIYITTDYSGLPKAIAAQKPGGKLVLVTDTNVDRCQAEECMEVLTAAGYDIKKIVIDAGERSKNLDTVSGIYRELIGMMADRQTILIALGGGVVGDITGFVAATFLRGIRFIQLPTTLLAQADSSVGGKVGVDFEGKKNVVGAFYQPKLVYMNVLSLRTLPEREMRSGMAEVLKHAIIRDADFYEYIDYNIHKVMSYDKDVLQYLVKVNCSIKADVVEQDEKDTGLRAILNFGHTIGHAVESASNFGLLHGECVSLGMAGAFKLAQLLEMTDAETASRVCDTLKKVGLPVKITGIDPKQVLEKMYYDKKVRDGKLLFVLPRRIGEVLQLSIDDAELVMKAVHTVVSV